MQFNIHYAKENILKYSKTLYFLLENYTNYIKDKTTSSTVTNSATHRNTDTYLSHVNYAKNNEKDSARLIDTYRRIRIPLQARYANLL